MADDLGHLGAEVRRRALARELRALQGKLYEDAMVRAFCNLCGKRVFSREDGWFGGKVCECSFEDCGRGSYEVTFVPNGALYGVKEREE